MVLQFQVELKSKVLVENGVVIYFDLLDNNTKTWHIFTSEFIIFDHEQKKLIGVLLASVQ